MLTCYISAPECVSECLQPTPAAGFRFATFRCSLLPTLRPAAGGHLPRCVKRPNDWHLCWAGRNERLFMWWTMTSADRAGTIVIQFVWGCWLLGSPGQHSEVQRSSLKMKEITHSSLSEALNQLIESLTVTFLSNIKVVSISSTWSMFAC